MVTGARGESTVAPELWFAIMTDRRYRVPCMRLAELHATHTPATFSYLFTWKSPAWDGKLGAWTRSEHAVCLRHLRRARQPGPGPAGSSVGQLPTLIQDAWTAFARTGSPQTPALADWQPYTAGRRSTMLLGATCGSVNAPFEAERRLWDARVTDGSVLG